MDNAVDALWLAVRFGRGERRPLRDGDTLEIWTRRGDYLGDLPAATVERFLSARLIDHALAAELGRALLAAPPLSPAAAAPVSRSVRERLREARKWRGGRARIAPGSTI